MAASYTIQTYSFDVWFVFILKYKMLKQNLKLNAHSNSSAFVENNFMVKIRKKQFLSSVIKSNVFSACKRSSICKMSTFFEDLSFLNPRSHLNVGQVHVLYRSLQPPFNWNVRIKYSYDSKNYPKGKIICLNYLV